MKDGFDREIDYLRVSLTERCNFSCVYCMPNGQDKKQCRDLLTESNYKQIIQIFRELGIDKIRFTGGEPLLSPHLENLIEFSKNLGIQDIAITSNGQGLSKNLIRLKEKGLKRVNISLDSLQEKRFKEITKNGEFSEIMASIVEAQKLGLKTKINCVLIKGINDDEIVDFLNLTEKCDIDIRFIELMPIGEGVKYEGVNPDIVLRSIPDVEYFSQQGSNTEGYYQKKGSSGRISLINPISCSFCDHCSRVRLTSRGTIKLCLHAKEEIDLTKYMTDSKILKEYIINSVLKKPEKHNMKESGTSSSEKYMYQIGG
ncbi:MAG: GTP 3',8-cyclase MoaA [Cetobacterium sp.]